MIVIGTAGHIDHGKSSIVKRLTGTDPDRLPEEKQRGMTIDLGFAFYRTPRNESIAFVDVPGHERFVKNMIAGASGIDAVMLVVAADDGWMLQTEEHFQIVRLLGVRAGFIVINKCDLVDERTLRSLQKEVRQKVKGSFLAEAPILSISAATGAGFEELSNHLNSLTNTISAQQDIGKARLYIDRVFVRQGIGSVATGTLKDGSFEIGQIVNAWPSFERGKIRTLQSNSIDVSKATPGQRTAISLTGAGKDKLIRGGAISSLDNLEYFKRNPVLALHVELLNDASVPLENKRRALLLTGTSEMEGEIRLFGRTQIAPGESGIVFFKPEDPIFTLVGDHFILRLPTPMVTLGGGVVLDHLTLTPRQKDIYKLDYLRVRNVENSESLIISELQKDIVVRQSELLVMSCHAKKDIVVALKLLIQDGRCGALGEYVFESKTIANVGEKVCDFVNNSLESRGGPKGVSLDEIAKFLTLEREIVKVVANILVKSNQLQIENDLYKLAGIASELPPSVQSAYNDIMITLNRIPFAPPALESLVSKGKTYKEAIGHLLKTGEIHKCGSEFIFLNSSWNDIESFIRTTLKNQKELRVGELRDKFSISRKYAVPILEETDRIKLTKRQGDIRVKGEMFERP